VTRVALLLAALFAAWTCAAQEPLRPAQRQELWVSAAITSRLPAGLRRSLGKSYKKVRLRGELGYRSADTFFAGRQLFLDVNARYKVSRWLALALEHRFAGRTQDPGLRNRTIVQAEAQKTLGRLTTEYRFIYQHSYVERTGQREVFRNRFQLGLDIKKWKLDPELSVELFTWAGYKGWSYFGTRWQLGTQVKLAKDHALTVALVHDRERDIAWPTHRWIGSLTYAMTLREL